MLHENFSTEIFVIDSVAKTNIWLYRITELNWHGEKTISNFYEKKFFLSNL